MTTDENLIDWAQVASLRDDVGEEDFDEVVGLFIEEVETELAGLAPDAGHMQLCNTLHFLKGSALNIGFKEMATLCGQGEAIAKNGVTDGIDIPLIAETFNASKAAFEAQI